MLTEVAWFRELPAEDRSWVGQIVQAGIQSFVEWYESDAGTTGELWSDSAVAVLGVRGRAAGPGRSDLAAADRRPGPAVDRGRGEQRRRPDRPGRRARRACRRAALCPRGGLRRRRGLREGRPRCAGPGMPGSRPWSSMRCSAPRPTRPCCRGRALLAGPQRGEVAVVLGGAPEQRTETDLFDDVRRAAERLGAGRPLCRAGRPPGGAARRRDGPERRRRAARGPLRGRTGRGRPGQRGPRARPRVRPGRAVGPSRRERLARGAAAGARAASCSPSGRWPATVTPVATSSRTSTCRCSGLAAR